MAKFDIFLSYQWDKKSTVEKLHENLNAKGFTIWRDVEQLKYGNLFDRLASGIENSKVFVCCITKNYIDSKSCNYEFYYAAKLNKYLLVLMLENLTIQQMKGIGFISNPLLRKNCYEDQTILQNWNGPLFEDIADSIRIMIQNCDRRSIEENTISNTPQMDTQEEILENNKILNDMANDLINEQIISAGELIVASAKSPNLDDKTEVQAKTNEPASILFEKLSIFLLDQTAANDGSSSSKTLSDSSKPKFFGLQKRFEISEDKIKKVYFKCFNINNKT